MRHLWADIRYAVRMLVKHPTLSVTAIVTFGLGIGLTTTVFSIVNGALYKGLPFDQAERIVSVIGTNPSQNIQRMPLAVQDLAVLEERQTVFEAAGLYASMPVNLSVGNDRPERFSAGQFTVGAFKAVGVDPILGRGFQEGDDKAAANPVILLSYEVWRDKFESSPEVIGQTVRANSVTRTVIGVMPEGFAFPAFERLWIPLRVDPLATQRGQGPAMPFVGRLAAGVSIEEARAQAATVFAALEQEFADTNQGVSALVLPYAEQFLGPEVFALLYTMLAAGIGVLLIACVNVSNLLLARASLRQREVAVRLALGAGRARIVTQMLTEVAVLSVLGTAVGMLLSSGAMRWFLHSIAIDPPPFWITFELDYRVMLFVMAITAAASLFAGLVPALQATGTNVAAAVKDDSRGSTGLRIGRFSGALVIAEVAVSCGLLIAAGLMIKSVVQLRNVPMPFETDTVLTARINLPRADYPDSAASIRFYEALLPKLRTLPGVEAATLSDGLPAAGNGALPVQVDGHKYGSPRDYPVVREGIVTPGYFETFSTPILRGRPFLPSDLADRELVAIVNQSFVDAYFDDGNVLGRRIKKSRPTDGDSPWLTVVGVVPDLLMEGIGNQGQNPAGYYIPIAQSDVANLVSIAVRSETEPASLASALRGAATELDPNLALFDVLTMNDVIARQTWFYTVFGTFFMAFGVIALFLAVAGLYGVMSFSVTQRTREMGIRTALGAPGALLIRLVVRRATIQLAVGLAIGLAIGIAATGPLQPLLYEVAPRDPLVLILVPVALAAAGLGASLLPARRAAHVDPVIALAAE
ncbi:MAG TPA: ABC transporter permease [Vicinamibacterales bacterium]|nr:ABC transporter permease [Vicinamibacterales bacterium]